MVPKRRLTRLVFCIPSTENTTVKNLRRTARLEDHTGLFRSVDGFRYASALDVLFSFSDCCRRVITVVIWN